MKNMKLVLLGALLIFIIVLSYFFILNFNNQEIKIAGSTSVQPVAQSLAKAYMEKNFKAKITVQGGDSLMGINSVRSGSVDIGTSSRNLTREESGGLTQYKIVNDGIAIIVNPKNPVNSLTTVQLKEIYQGRITNWKQVGGGDEPIKVIIREEGSGTRQAFEDMILGNDSLTNNNTIAISTYQVVHDVASDPNTIGYVSMNSLNPDVKALSINDVTLNKENIENGKYGLQRPLLFLVKGTVSSTVQNFINFVLSPEGQSIINNTEYESGNESEILGVGPGGGI